MTLKEELLELDKEMGIIEYTSLSAQKDREIDLRLKSGEELPPNIIKASNGAIGYFKVTKADISEAEIDKLIKYRQTKYLRTIKNCLVFITVLYVLGFIFSLLGWF